MSEGVTISGLIKLKREKLLLSLFIEWKMDILSNLIFLFSSLYLPLYKSIFVWPVYATQRYKRYENTFLLAGNDEFLN